jgi:1,2-dihydroxy-3-keto-5-methylthiopentene dioxygenase
MVNAYYIKDDGTRDETRAPPSMETIKLTTGVQCWKIDSRRYKTDDKIAIFRKRPDYSFEDIATFTNDNVKKVGGEHLHVDGEVRVCLSGGGNVDVRDTEDNWLRLEVRADDMWAVAPGVYHRFSLGDQVHGTFLRIGLGLDTWKADFREKVNENCLGRKIYRQLATVGFDF